MDQPPFVPRIIVGGMSVGRERDAKVTHVTVFLLNLPRPRNRVPISSEPGIDIRLDPGPLEYGRAQMAMVRSTGSAAIQGSPILQTVRISEGSYLVIEQKLEGPLSVDHRSRALHLADEAAAVVALGHPATLIRKIYQDVVSTPDQLVWFPNDPVTLETVLDVDPDQHAKLSTPALERVKRLESMTRLKFQKAARWYLRALLTSDRLARLLYFWTVLEVYPAEGDQVVNSVKKFVAERVFGNRVTDSQVKESLQLGRIDGLRNDVVHKGLSTIDEELESRIDGYLKRLHATATVCLRVLLGGEPGHDLDKFISSEPMATS